MHFRVNSLPKDRISALAMFWSLFWLAASSVLFFCIYWFSFGFFLDDPWSPLKLDWFSAASAIAVLWALIAIAFFAQPGEQMRLQELRNEPSWIFYTYWGLITGGLLWAGIEYFYIESAARNFYEGRWWHGLVPPLAIMAAKFANELATFKQDPFTFTRFASGSVSTKDDKFDFGVSARNTALAIQSMRGYVNVVAIYGGFGYGKSSFARMLVENLDPDKTLYTYISLTETNEARDFSMLFQERWLETLAMRYPKFDITSRLPFMYSILRESGQGLLSDALQVIAALNRGLIRTRAKVADEFYGHTTDHTSPAIGTIFGNIPEIHETNWVIIIDELERARVDEIYRAVEIIERFRNEGRPGLPVKLVFILCISEPEFRQYINSCKSHDPRFGPLSTFFAGDGKSITKRISVPPVDLKLRQEFADELLRKVASEHGFAAELPDPISPHVFGSPSNRFPEDHKAALEYVVGTLAEESPRTVSRVAISTDLFYRSFRDKTGGVQQSPIRFSDVVALELIKIKYPYLIEFFTNTIGYLITKSRWDGGESYFLKKELEQKKAGILEWITMETGHEFTPNEKEIVRDQVGLVAHYYFDFLSQNYDYDNKIQYFGTSSYPENLYDYLTTVSEGIESSHRKHSSMYMRHRDGTNNFLKDLENLELSEYARFIYHVGSAPREVRLDLIAEMKERLLSGRVPLEPGNVEQTVTDELIYQLLFQLHLLIDYDRRYSDTKLSGDTTYVFETLRDVLSSPSLAVGPKFLTIQYFSNMDRGSGNMELRIKSAFKKLLPFYNDELAKLIDGVFEGANRRYIDGKEVLYDNEENFFYVMYQNWSGSKDASVEIEKIRSAAARGLENHPEALRRYWHRYPLEKGWRDADDIFNDWHHTWNEHNGALYMPLEKLIPITKGSELIKDTEIARKVAFWEGIRNDERVKKREELKDDESTLRARFIKGTFLKP